MTNPIQEKILNIAWEKDISNMTLREIGNLVGDTSPQKIKYHLEQLEAKGLLVGRRPVEPYEEVDGIVRIPIVRYGK